MYVYILYIIYKYVYILYIIYKPAQHTQKQRFLATVLPISDIDECSGNHTCDSADLCMNTPGSFTCICPPGYALDSGVCTGKLD